MQNKKLYALLSSINQMRPANSSHLSSEAKWIKNPAIFLKIGIVLLMSPLILFPLHAIVKVSHYDGPLTRLLDDAAIKEGVDLRTNSSQSSALEGYLETTEKSHDRFLGGLLSPRFDESSCLSRYQSNLYRKLPIHQPSSHLISRLRNYEALHKRCGPRSEPYRKASEHLRSAQGTSSSGCKYLIWTPVEGLGNRMLSLASAFLYALLINRVLLVDPRANIPDLFCEPFPEVSWILPSDFPLVHQLKSFNQRSSRSYGNMLKNDVISHSTASTLPPYIYLHLVHDYDDHDKLFFCDDDQAIIQKVTWLIVKSDHYFVPPLFLIPSFAKELNSLFPEKETVFHHLGWYLFHPANSVWGLITRYYESYLARADEKIGIQVRVFDTGGSRGPLKHVMEQIWACAMKENLLPQISNEKAIIKPSGKQKIIAVLMTCLTSGYFEQLRTRYWQYPSANGEMIALFQPSHEEQQQTGKQKHDRKALAEMYLLSLTDKLVTSGMSTFGYVAQSLGGLKPWILYKPKARTPPNPSCQHASSMEPCFHYNTHFYTCKNKNGSDTIHVPHLHRCEDRIWGVKLADTK